MSTARTRRLGLALLGGLLAPGIAAAQQPSTAQTNAVRQNCRTDFQSYCTGVAPGGRSALNCLQENMTSLSPACQQAVEAIGPAPNTAAPPVTVQGTAPSAAPPPGMAPAPSGHRPASSPMSINRACAGDFREFCRGVHPGSGNILACLRANASNLSAPCQQALSTLRR